MPLGVLPTGEILILMDMEILVSQNAGVPQVAQRVNSMSPTVKIVMMEMQMLVPIKRAILQPLAVMVLTITIVIIYKPSNIQSLDLVTLLLNQSGI
jgi:hypothetical protein